MTARKRLNLKTEARAQASPMVVIKQHPWERYESETDPEWGAFVIYRDLSPDIRTLRMVVEENPNLKYNTIRRYCEANRWVERARLYDEYKDKKLRSHRESAQRAVEEEVRKATDAVYTMFLQDLERKLTDARETAELAAFTWAQEQGVPTTKVNVEVRFSTSTWRDIATTLKILNAERRTSVGLPSTISSAKIESNQTISFEDQLRSVLDGPAQED